jgi:hypothetical protein
MILLGFKTEASETGSWFRHCAGEKEGVKNG